MPSAVQKISISLPFDRLRIIEWLKKDFKLPNRSAVFDYLLREKEKKNFYHKVHEEAKELAKSTRYQKQAKSFARLASKNAARFFSSDGENYSTW